MLLSALAADKSSDADDSEDRRASPANKSSAVDKPRDRGLFPLLAILMLLNLIDAKKRQEAAVKWSPKNEKRALAAALVNAQAADKSSAADKPQDRSLAAVVALVEVALLLKKESDKAAEKLENRWLTEKKELRDQWFANML